MADFKLGRIKFKWRGDWSTSTAYLIDDIIKYGGNTYVVIVNHTSAASISGFYTDLTAAKYSLHTEGLFFKGNWAASTFYKLNDLVKNGAYQYRCILQHTSAGSFAIGSNWQVFTEGLQWEDSYSAGTTYSDGDVVTYGGYTYVYVNDTPASGQTPIDNAYWDVVTTGFKAQGDYSAGTAYKTGDTINFGGWSYVCVIDTTSGQNPYTHANKWTVINEGFNWLGTYSAATTYYKGDVVSYVGSSFLAIAHNILNVAPGTDAAKWVVLTQGAESNVLSTRGDIIIRDAAGAASLNIGGHGALLVSDGNQPVWAGLDGRVTLYVANSGSDSNPGTKQLPFKTIKYALEQSGKGDVVEFLSQSGGIGGAAGNYTSAAVGGSGSGLTVRVEKAGDSSAPTVKILDGGRNYVAGDTVTVSGANIGNSNTLTLVVKSVSTGDVIWVANGCFREILPLKVPAGVTVRGESLRSTEVRPASGKSSTISTVSSSSTIAGATNGTYSYIHKTSTSGTGNGIVVNVTIAGNVFSSVSIYHGGYGFVIGDTITINTSTIGCAGTGSLILTVTQLENNDASYMWLLNDTTNLRLMTLRGMTGTATHTGRGAVICSLDPEGNISSQSPYLQDMTSVNANATGILIDGLLHNPNPSSNKSILATHFTQINSDGIGIWANGGGRAEMVSCFTYFCNKSYYATAGGFIRGLNGSSCYGEQGAVADGTLASESAIGVQSNGEMLKYNNLGFVSPASQTDIQNSITTNGSGTATILGLTSGATATFLRYNVALNYLHIKNRIGNFTKGETIRITKQNSSQFSVSLDATFGSDDSSTIAQKGQVGPLIAVKSGTTSLTTAGLITVGANIKFTGNSKYYRVNAVTEENTAAGTATVRLTEYVVSGDAIANDTVANVTVQYSNVRLTGHDFLNIGTGDIITTNYPGVPTQPADQADEVEELTGGRVYFVSTDQNGDFRVGDLFRIQQATGIATLNADAFDLSGLSELQLGSIGAELGATINEFSTDETLSGNSNTAVPTENAVLGYLTRDNAGTSAWVPPTGTTGERPTGGNLYTGALRYNSTLTTWEGYNGTAWTGLGGGNPWVTKTVSDTGFTAANNDRIFVNTTGGAITINLPASPTVGDNVRFLDSGGTFNTNNLTIGRNSLKIQGLAENLTVSTQYAGFQLVYSGTTNGWMLLEK
jgi:hypothetical protein